jgi:TPR repeat protein
VNLRQAVSVLVLAFALTASEAHATDLTGRPGLQPFGADALAALRQLRGGNTAGGFAVLEKMVEAGRADAAEGLGEVYGYGYGVVPVDRRKACRYFAIASVTRLDSMHNLAICYERGVVGAADFSEAARLYRRAGEMGFLESKCALGSLYLHGRGVPQDKPMGLSLCREAAEAGAADAQAVVGNIYFDGDGVPRDPIEARRWYEKAAVLNQPSANFRLGEIYWKGDGVPKDTAMAAAYWRIAYEHGRLDAASYLGDEAMHRAFLDFQPGKSLPPLTQVEPEALAAAVVWYDKALDGNPGERRADIEGRLKLLRELQAKLLPTAR